MYTTSSVKQRVFKWLFGITLCYVLLINPSTAAPPVSGLNEPRIINGSPASTENTKYIVSIRLKQYEKIFGNGHMCGGTLIGRNKVLTAAHCLYNSDKKRYRKANEFVVVMGTLNRFKRVNGTIVSEVKSIAYMNTFSMDTMRDDIGLLFLKTGLPANKTHLTVEPIVMTNTSTPAGASCLISGWGKTEKNSLSPILLSANVTTISRKVCSISYGTSLLNGMMCAGYISGGIDSCQGDSGGPLVHNNTLVGVVSWGIGCAQPGFPGIYADVRYYYKWINDHNSGTTINGRTFNLILVLILSFVSYF